METYRTYDLKDVAGIIAAGNPDPYNSNNVVAKILYHTPDLGITRVILGSYDDGKEKRDFDSPTSVSFENVAFLILVDRLVNEGKPIFAVYGRSDDTCYLKWTILPMVVVLQKGPGNGVVKFFGPFGSIEDPILEDILRLKGYLSPDESVDLMSRYVKSVEGRDVSVEFEELYPSAENIL